MRLRKGPASAGPFRVWVVLVPLLLGGACINPFAKDLPESSPEPLPGLGERPAGAPAPIAEAGAVSTATTTSSPASPRSTSGLAGTGATTTTVAGGASTPTTGTISPTAARTVARADDPGGDAGVGGPAYADARVLVIEDLGTRARVTVKMAATLPTTLATEEVMGIGVDLFRTNGGESEYQLFADGGSDGWRAFLQTPAGFVDYPGQFRLGGDTVQFEVAWSEVGGRPTGSVSSFADWGKPTVAGVVTRTQDLVPDGGRIPLTP